MPPGPLQPMRPFARSGVRPGPSGFPSGSLLWPSALRGMVAAVRCAAGPMRQGWLDIHLAPIDIQCLAGHEIAVGGHQEHQRAEQIFRHHIALDGT